MPVTVCWAAKGGSGTTVVAASLALSCPTDSLLVDLDGELPAVLGARRAVRPGHRRLAGVGRAAGARSPTSPSTSTARRGLIPRGTRPSTSTSPRWPELLDWLAATTRRRSSTPAPGRRRRASLARRRPHAARHPRLLPRRCSAPSRPRCRPDGVVLVAEPGRSLRAADVEHAVGAPVVATVSVDSPSPAPSTPGCSTRARAARLLARASLRRCGMSRRRRASTSTSSPRCAGPPSIERGDADAVVRAHLRRVAPLAGPDAGEAPRARRRRPARRARRARRRCSPTTPSTRCSSTPTATSGSSATAGMRRRSATSPPATSPLVIERILAPLGRRLDRTQPDRRRPPRRRLAGLRRHPADRRPTAPACRSAASATGRSPSTRSPPTPSRGARAARRRALQRRRQRGDLVGQDVAAQRHARPLRRPASASSRSRTPPSCCRPPITSCASRRARRRRTGRRRSRSSSSCARRCGCGPTGSSSARCAGPEVLALVQALNTGHDGSWSTCHANSALDAAAPPGDARHPGRAGVAARPPSASTSPARSTSSSTSPATPTARRQVVEIGEVVVDRDRLGLRPIADAERVVGQVTRFRA